ncbi:MAG: hypothetical protein RL345_2997, partial [Chloroflexota bacterium]
RPPETATSVGVSRLVFEPSPSCPKGPFPQQYAVRVLVNPHVCALPAAIVVKVRPPETATSVGVSRSVFEPSPSCPLALYPQQYAMSVLVNPQVYATPWAMLTNATFPTVEVSTFRVRTDCAGSPDVAESAGEAEGATVAVLVTVTEGDVATVGDSVGETVATGVAVTVIVMDGATDATPVASGVLVPTGTCAVAGNAPPWRMTATADRDASRTGTIRYVARRCGIASSSFCDLAATSPTQA